MKKVYGLDIYSRIEIFYLMFHQNDNHVDIYKRLLCRRYSIEVVDLI